MSSRDRPALENALGLLLDVLALRIDAGGEPTFRELVHRVRDVVNEAFAHQRVPFEKIVAALKRKADPVRAPVFQIAINLDIAPSPRAPAGQTWAVTVPDTGSVPYELAVELTDTGDDLSASFEYRADRFERTTIERLAAELVAVLRHGIDDPDRPISQSNVDVDLNVNLNVKTWTLTLSSYRCARSGLRRVARTDAELVTPMSTVAFRFKFKSTSTIREPVRESGSPASRPSSSA